MSLVAYAASDNDSESDDDETGTSSPNDEETRTPNDDETRTRPPDDNETGTSPPNDDETGTIPPNDDETRTSLLNDDETRTSPPNDDDTGTSLPVMNHQVDYEDDVIQNANRDFSAKETHIAIESRESLSSIDATTGLLGLPVPKMVGIDQVSTEEEELEDLVKPKSSQMANIPKPPPQRFKQPVRITIPSLPSNSDDEEDEPAPKKTKISGITSGLTSMLPAPVHVTKKVANRSLLPYTLTKKNKPNLAPTAAKPTITVGPSEADSKNIIGLANYDSDDDEQEEDTSMGEINFFSLETSKTPERLPDYEDNVTSSQDAPLPEGSEPEIVGNTETSQDDDLSNSPQMDSALQFTNADLPLNFDSNRMQTFSSAQLSSSNLGHIGPQRENYTYQYDELPEQEEPNSEDHEKELDNILHDEQFLRLQGKQQRGREEINFVDVKADDFVDPSELTKNLSEESSYQPHRQKDNLPTSQQKRKHQITYLAYQAKERELELKNQWALNKTNKRQAQSKYGF